MKTNLLFHNRRVLSLEVFPPKKTAPIDTIYRTLDELKGIQPDFISVTYGAGGSENSKDTLRIASDIVSRYHIESVAHLPGIHLTKQDVSEMLFTLKQKGIENILALRGDKNPHYKEKNDFRYASDLVEFISRNGDFNVIGACYPEVHQEAANMQIDIQHLKRKVEAGVTQLISQLFFDNSAFYLFLDRVRAQGIGIPIQAGIMPATNQKQIERIAALCGAKFPPKFIQMMERYKEDDYAMREAGIEYAIQQIRDLLSNGVDGIHLYTMNNADTVQRIHEEISEFM